MRRGTKEMDLILERFAGSCLASMDGPTLNLYEALLCENDQEIYAWITGQTNVPDRYSSLIQDIAAHVDARQVSMNLLTRCQR